MAYIGTLFAGTTTSVKNTEGSHKPQPEAHPQARPERILHGANAWDIKPKPGTHNHHTLTLPSGYKTPSTYSNNESSEHGVFLDTLQSLCHRISHVEAAHVEHTRQYVPCLTQYTLPSLFAPSRRQARRTGMYDTTKSTSDSKIRHSSNQPSSAAVFKTTVQSNADSNDSPELGGRLPCSHPPTRFYLKNNPATVPHLPYSPRFETNKSSSATTTLHYCFPPAPPALASSKGALMNHEHTCSCVGTPSRSLPTTDRLGGFARARRATVMMSSAVTASILAQTSCATGKTCTANRRKEKK